MGVCGFAIVGGGVGQVAVQIVRELQKGISCASCRECQRANIIHQLNEEGVELGYDTYTVPLAPTRSTIYALGPLPLGTDFGGLKGGQSRDILMHNKNRACFVLPWVRTIQIRCGWSHNFSFGDRRYGDSRNPPTGVTTYEHG
jgi:hypothetical protein